jgi:class 3 adenylate cyclase
VAQGYATLGTIGFEGRWDYAAIGNVTNLAARLCGEASAGQVLVDRKIMARIEDRVLAQPAGPFALKGLAQPVPAFQVLGWAAG